MKTKRTKSIKIRLTQEEHEALLNRCGDIPLAEWLRTLGMGQEINLVKRRKRYSSVDPLLIRQLAALGNNVNQIARVVNTVKQGIDRIWLLSALNSVKSSLEAIRKDNQNDSDIS